MSGRPESSARRHMREAATQIVGVIGATAAKMIAESIFEGKITDPPESAQDPKALERTAAPPGGKDAL